MKIHEESIMHESPCKQKCRCYLVEANPPNIVGIGISEAIELMNSLLGPNLKLAELDTKTLPDSIELLDVVTGEVRRVIQIEEVLCIGRMVKALSRLKSG